MNQKQKLWLTLGCEFFAFGYALDGYQDAAIFFSLIGMIFSIEAHGWKSVYRSFFSILVFGGLSSMMVICSPLFETMYSIGVVVFSSVFTAILFQASSYRVLKNTASYLRIVMVCFFLFILILPVDWLMKGEFFLVVGFAFVPFQITYFKKWYQIHQKNMNLRMETKSNMYYNTH